MSMFICDFQALEERLLGFLGYKPRKHHKIGLSRATAAADLVLELRDNGTYEILKDRASDGKPFNGAVFVGQSSILKGTVTGRVNHLEPESQNLPGPTIVLCEGFVPGFIQEIVDKDFLEVGDAIRIEDEKYTVKKILSPRHVLLALGPLRFVYQVTPELRIAWNPFAQEWDSSKGNLISVRELRPEDSDCFPPRRADSVHPNTDDVGYVVQLDEDDPALTGPGPAPEGQ